MLGDSDGDGGGGGDGMKQRGWRRKSEDRQNVTGRRECAAGPIRETFMANVADSVRGLMHMRERPRQSSLEVFRTSDGKMERDTDKPYFRLCTRPLIWKAKLSVSQLIRFPALTFDYELWVVTKICPPESSCTLKESTI